MITRQLILLGKPQNSERPSLKKIKQMAPNDWCLNLSSSLHIHVPTHAHACKQAQVHIHIDTTKLNKEMNK